MKTDMPALIESIKKFRFNSFFVRNLLIIMIVILVPMTAIGVAFCSMVQQSADKEIELIAANTLTTVKKTVDTIIRTAEMFAIQTSFEPSVESFIYATQPTKNISKAHADIREHISSFTSLYKYIHSVYVYSEKGNLVIHNSDYTDADSFKDQSWKPYYQELPVVGHVIVPRKYADRYPSFISVIRSVGADETEKSGCIVVNIDVEQINEAIHEEKEQQTSVFLVDEAQTIYLSHDIKLIGQTCTDLSKLVSIKTDRGDEKDRRPSYDYIYSESDSQWYDLKYVSFMPNFYFGDMIQHSARYMFILLILLFISAVLITLLISFRTYAPIQSLLSFLTPQELNDSQNKSHNEITYITENIKQSIDANKRLEQELNYRLLLLNKAQLYALQTQISPHFMNNVLEMISWTAISEMGMTNKVSKMLKSLSGLLNISLDGEHYLIPIEEELQHANLYTYLMSENYGDELNFVWEIDKELHDCKMLKLTLQPILENAIEHGIKRKRSVGEIRIFGRVINGDIELTIRDNGVGMAEEELEKLCRDLNDTSEMFGRHIGIRNVNQRIKLVFGEEYGLSVDSKKGEGTTVRILIPKIHF